MLSGSWLIKTEPDACSPLLKILLPGTFGGQASTTNHWPSWCYSRQTAGWSLSLSGCFGGYDSPLLLNHIKLYLLFRICICNGLTEILMTQINFRRLFGILFTTFIFILVFIFAVIAITENLTIISASILIIIPLAIRYAVYTLSKI